MKVTRLSPSGKVHTADLPITPAELAAFERGGDLPNLPPEWREFLMTGITPAEWKQTFGKVRSAPYDGPEIGPVAIVEGEG